MINDDLLGGYLIWRGRKVFFDGRLQVYPENVYLDWQRLLDDPASFPDVARRWKAGAVILHHPSPGRLELARVIANTAGWRIAYLDGAGIVLVAAGGDAAAAPEGALAAVEGFSAPGLAGRVERIASLLRRHDERSDLHYQRGRAIHYLWGAQAYGFAREDFRRALLLDPANRDADAGLRATASP